MRWREGNRRRAHTDSRMEDVAVDDSRESNVRSPVRRSIVSHCTREPRGPNNPINAMTNGRPLVLCSIRIHPRPEVRRETGDGTEWVGDCTADEERIPIRSDLHSRRGIRTHWNCRGEALR